MNFNELNDLKEDELLAPDALYNPYAGKDAEGNWKQGWIDVKYLNSRYGKYGKAEDLINNALTEGHKLFFGWLKEKRYIE